MKEIKLVGLTKHYGIKKLFENIDLSIRTGQKIGLIGPNGAGKSSLLKAIASIDNYDQGQIIKPNQYRIVYLDQNPQLDSQKTILESIYDSPAIEIQLLLKYEQIRNQFENNPTNEKLLNQLTQIQEEITRLDAWDIETKAKIITSQLQLKDLNQTIENCSGGERKRIGLAQVLIDTPDLLILDEPTNHLDIQSIQWLEKFLAQYQGSLLLVTHDRYFLERVVDTIVELKHGKLSLYEGNYQKYLEQKFEQTVNLEKQQDKENKLFKQELAWMRKGAKARTTKQQARIDRFHNLKDTISNRDQEQGQINFDFQQKRIGNQIIEFEGVDIKIGNQSVVQQLTKHFIKGERLGIVGDNGVGKTTLLNTIAGYHPIDNGKLIIGQTVHIAYYRQLDEDLPNDLRVLDYLLKVADQFKISGQQAISASQLLERFNFPRHTHGTLIGQLSGGERRRLYLLSLLVQQPNILLLDEPTNDLDIETLATIEDYLQTFEGVVIIVSHDRYFLDKVVDQILEIQGQGNYQFYWGNFSDYLGYKEAEMAANIDLKGAKTDTRQISKFNGNFHDETSKKKLSYHEKRELEALPGEISDLEAKIDTITRAMNQVASDAEQLMSLQSQLEEFEGLLLNKYDRYEQLELLNE